MQANEFYFFFQEAYPAPWSTLLTYRTSLLCCWCLLSVRTALSEQGSPSCFSQFPNTAFLPTPFRTAGIISNVPELLCDVFYFFFFSTEGPEGFLKPSVAFCISILRNNSYRRARTKEKVGLNSDNCSNNIMLGCIVI